MYLLYGFGKSLQSLAVKLELDSIDFVICDDHQDALQSVPTHLQSVTASEFLNNPLPITNLVISPGIHQSKPIVQWAKQQQIPIDNDISLYLKQNLRGDHILVTGTFGKSTCVSLIHSVCKKLNVDMQLGGNVGIPVFDLDMSRRAILELSAQQLDLCESPASSVAIVLNLYPQHLDWYDNLDVYYKTKLKILQHSACPIFAYEDLEFVMKNVALEANYKTISTRTTEADFALVNNCFYEYGQMVGAKSESAAEVSSLGAYAALRSIGISPDDTISSLAQSMSLPHRCEVLHNQNGLLIINDSKSTNLSNTIYAIQKYADHGKIVCIMGGKDTPQDMRKLEDIAYLVDLFITTGSNGKKLHEHLTNSVYMENIVDCIALGLVACQNGGVLLFSPGYPSTDQYRNFEHRGDLFRGLLKQSFAYNR